MTQQIRTFTTGELSASIEGHGEFNARSVEFMGSVDELDFLLWGDGCFQRLDFLFSTFGEWTLRIGRGQCKQSFLRGGQGII